MVQIAVVINESTVQYPVENFCNFASKMVVEFLCCMTSACFSGRKKSS